MMFRKYPKHDVKHYEKLDVLHHVLKNDRNVTPVHCWSQIRLSNERFSGRLSVF